MPTKKEEHVPKLAWGITGAGDYLPQVFGAMADLKKKQPLKITAILSKAAVQVIKIYRLWDELHEIADKVMIEKDANTPFVVGALQTKKYDLLLTAPVTGNTTAKIVHGISDSLLSNVVSMTNRTTTPIFVLPVEKEGRNVSTRLPDGSMLELLTRDIDAKNTGKLTRMKGITVLDGPDDIATIMNQF